MSWTREVSSFRFEFGERVDDFVHSLVDHQVRNTYSGGLRKIMMFSWRSIACDRGMYFSRALV